MGVLTAAHCDDAQTYYQTLDLTYPVTFIAARHGDRRDVQWHTTSHYEYPQFYDGDSYRTVSFGISRASQSVGDFVCHRGKATNYSCGELVSKTYVPSYEGACPGVDECYPVWMKVSGPNLKCFPGDSGGPWFFGTHALGIYKGQASTGTDAAGCDFAFYMAIDYIDGLDVALLTN